MVVVESSGNQITGKDNRGTRLMTCGAALDSDSHGYPILTSAYHPPLERLSL